jgi:3-methyladenine DNA glycosylase AlkD
MDYNLLFTNIEKYANEEKAGKMTKYMRNLFPFLGIQRPQLSLLIKPHLQQLAEGNTIDWNFVELCWQKPYREAQYVAIEYLLKVASRTTRDDMERIKQLIVTKSWWDTVDAISKIAGIVVLKYPELKQTLLECSYKNFWLRRVAILFQLQYREKTDTLLLEQIIKNNFNTGEFFIDKATGWILRQYSKTNPLWVRDFMDRYHPRLSGLTIREASKYL